MSELNEVEDVIEEIEESPEIQAEVIEEIKKPKAKKKEVFVPREAPWIPIQRFLKKKVNYPGAIDGQPGRLTISSLQLLLIQEGFRVEVTGLASTALWKALQEWLNERFDAGLEISGWFDEPTLQALQKVEGEI